MAYKKVIVFMISLCMLLNPINVVDGHYLKDEITHKAGPVTILYSEKTLSDGYIEIEYKKTIDNRVYLIMIRDNLQDSSEESKYIFNASELKSKSKCNLPYINSRIEILRISKEEYNDFKHIAGIYSFEIIDKFIITANINLSNPDDFVNKTIWFNWDDHVVEEMASHIYRGSKNKKEFVDQVAQWIYDNINYSYDAAYRIKEGTLLNNPLDVNQTLTLRSGVCANKAALMAVMLRSQGIPCQYVSGRTTELSKTKHAWNRVYLNDEWIDYDVTMNTSGNLNYIVEAIK